ncbi:MAG: pyruvate formate-lyase-activating protein [Succinivibrionaceae bacterium]|nr:pyruvate formate-lyase-activating protein [Succinivibrionaceae bacterium]
MTQGHIHSFETFGSVDGPGVRFVVFVQGCRMRCRYCHNPDTWKIGEGELWNAEDIMNKALRYKPYWGNEGGVTVSGGEPLLQLEFVTELFELLKKNGINTCLDTAGGPFNDDPEWLAAFDRLMKSTDLVMLDIKHIDSAKHKELTGIPNENILACARHMDELGTKMWIRHVLVPGYTDSDEQLNGIHEFVSQLKNVTRVEVLPYHMFGKYKWEKLGLKYTLEDVDVPTDESVKHAKEILHAG